MTSFMLVEIIEKEDAAAPPKKDILIPLYLY